MVRAFAALVIVAAFLGLPSATVAATWGRVETPNFIVFSETGEKRASDIATEFERFREAIAQVLPSAALGSPTPTLVVVFASERSFAPYQPQRDGRPVGLGGFFARDHRQNFIALSFQHRDDAMQVAFHEYAHLMVANLPLDLPAWLNEGLAEFYSTLQVTRGGRAAELGRPIHHHLQLLRRNSLLSLEQLLAWEGAFDEERERRSMYYAQSWALVHMLVTAEPSRSADLSRYGGIAGSGADPIAAWRNIFGDMNVRQQLGHHIHRPVLRSFALQFEQELPKIRGAASAAEPADMQAVLEALRRAARLTEASEAAPPPEGRSPLGSALLGIHRLQQGRAAEAETLLLQASEDRSDWLVQYYVASGLAEMIASPGSTLIPRAALAVEAVLAARPWLAHVWALKARVHLAHSGQEAAALEAITRARQLAPGRADYNLIAAEVLAQQRDYARARAMVGPLLSSAYAPETREAARRFMGHLLEQEHWTSRTASGSIAGTNDSEPATLPALRRLQEGEHRTQGMFEGIECSAGGIALLVRTSDRLERFRAPGMEAVAFITYRDDTQRAIGCGPRPQPERVTVTWRPIAGDGARRAVAVELLPEPR